MPSILQQMLRALAASLACSAFVCPEAHAYRPFDQTDAAVADPRGIEVEIGSGFARPGGDHLWIAPALVFNYGFLLDWEVVLEGKGLLPGAGGPYRIDETGLSVKHVFQEGALQGKTGPSAAFEMQALLPTVNAELGAGAGATAIVSQSWPLGTVHANAELAWNRAHRWVTDLGTILEGPSSWPVRPAAEVYVEAPAGEATAYNGLVGAIWQIDPDLAADLGVHVGLALTIETEIRVGVTWAWKPALRI